MSLAALLSVGDAPGGLSSPARWATPAEAVVPSGGDFLRSESTQPKVIQLRPSGRNVVRTAVVDQAQLRAHQFEEDTRQSWVAQAEALTIDAPDSPTAWARLAQTLLAVGRIEDAADAARLAWDRARDIVDGDVADVGDRPATYVAAQVLIATGNQGDAEQGLARVWAEPGPWTCLYAALASNRGDFEQALARLAGSAGTEAASLRGYVLLRLQRFDQAVRELRQAGGIVSGGPSVAANIAYSYAALGAVRKAVAAAQSAVALAPHDPALRCSLAAYLDTAGQRGMALRELRQFQSMGLRPDPAVAQTAASLLLQEGRTEDARRELARVVDASRGRGSTRPPGEVIGFASFIQWRSKLRTRSEYIDVLRRELARIQGKSVQLAAMLADIVNSTSVHDEIAGYYRQLSKTESEESLLPLKLRLTLASGELDAAVDESRRWATAFPLSVDAAQTYVTLAGTVAGDYAAASTYGLSALRRLPNSSILMNNTAFALAMVGRVLEADRVLARANDNLMYVAATQGLIRLAQGRLREGLSFYTRAEDLAGEQAADRIEAEDSRLLIRLYRLAVRYHLGLVGQADLSNEALGVNVPRDWHSNPQLLIVERMFKRVGAPWPVP